LNGSQVRLKDILELLAGANIGQTGHHIISQGEADKILSASPRERREMLEDALGLKAYQYKIEESERKLEKTEENMRQVGALRKEIAPHLRFLKRQVEKVQKAQELKESAMLRFRQYFKNEETYLSESKKKLERELSQKKNELAVIAAKVADAKRALAGAEGDKRAAGILDLSRALDEARAMRAEAARKAARLEGQIEALEKTAAKASVSASDVSRILEENEKAVAALSGGTLESAVAFIKNLLEKLRTLVRSARESGGDMDTLIGERDKLLAAEKDGAKKETELSASLENIRKELEDARLKEREKERALFELASEEREAKHVMENLMNEGERLSLLDAEFKRDIAEAVPLIGREVAAFMELVADASATRESQEREKRELEKIKIRLEEMGAAGGEEMLKEYQEATEREAFLEKELADLETAKEQLKNLIENLKHELSGRFTSGIDSINKEFSHLFSVMFDGGTASLVKTQEAVKKPALLDVSGEGDEMEDEPKDKKQEFVEGIDIALSIPRKRVKSLVMLSGGERALTSIALIFAMSSVNPPPFLILDETDAALDEANSRRYGDMVATLSEKSQLIVITHNRETMSRAGILYGVTMGNDGVSKVLSVKLEEAVKVAK
jgi:chromosome segregation protein